MRLGSPLFAALLAVTLGVALAEGPVPKVARVFPSGPEVPANLLRISIELSAPVGGPLLPRVSLTRADGETVTEPFLEQELWSPDGRILTILLHPGRVKSGLNARDEIGPILSAGEDVVISLDGREMQRWRVVAPDGKGPSAAAWILSEVHAGSMRALVVTLDEPIDARAANHLAVRDRQGRRVKGRVQLTNGEKTWIFSPREPWRSGRHELVIRGTLEDPSGNRLGHTFESFGDSSHVSPPDVVIAFVPLATRSHATKQE
jgi:hypothetical protein